MDVMYGHMIQRGILVELQVLKPYQGIMGYDDGLGLW